MSVRPQCNNFCPSLSRAVGLEPSDDELKNMITEVDGSGERGTGISRGWFQLGDSIMTRNPN